MIALVGSLAHSLSSSCVTKAVSPFAHLAESASCLRGNVSLDFRRSYKYLLPSSLWSKTKSWPFLSFSSNFWLDNLDKYIHIFYHWNSFGWWEVKKSNSLNICENLVFETGTWPSNKEKSNHIHSPFANKWWYCGLCVSESESIQGTSFGPSQCWPLSKTGQSRWDLSDRSGKAPQIFHSVWPRSTETKTYKTLPGLLTVVNLWCFFPLVCVSCTLIFMCLTWWILRFGYGRFGYVFHPERPPCFHWLPSPFSTPPISSWCPHGGGEEESTAHG